MTTYQERTSIMVCVLFFLLISAVLCIKVAYGVKNLYIIRYTEKNFIAV